MDITLDYHKDHKDWTSRMKFYQDEIRFFFKELNMVFDQDKQNLARMEFIDEYEAILDKKSSQIEELLSRIDQVERDTLNDSENAKLSKTHNQLHLDILKFEEAYDAMKKRFKRFASHND